MDSELQCKESCKRDTQAAGHCEKDPESCENDLEDCDKSAAEDSEDADMRRELFRQTKDAFLKRPIASFRHKVSHNSRRYR